MNECKVALPSYTTLAGIWAMSEFKRYQFFKQNRGLQARVAKRAGVDPSVVSKVANQQARSAKVEEAFEKELSEL